MSDAHSFHLVAEWSFLSTIEAVSEVLSDPEAFPRWWGDVYLDVKLTDPGDPNGLGRTVDILSRGALPYKLRWQAKLVEDNRPDGWVIEATGDLEGRGEWILRQDRVQAFVTYVWQVKAERPVLRALSPVLKPLFAWNHRWAMAKGQAGLEAELARRAQRA